MGADGGAILGDDAFRISESPHLSLIDPQEPIAYVPQIIERVRHHEDRSRARELLDESLAFCLERLIADGQSFVDDENVRIGMSADGKSQPRHHAARVIFHLLIEK